VRAIMHFATRPSLVLPIVLSVACAATATFHSKNGQTYAPLTERAVRCDEGEARTVVAAGGEVIGTITAKALSVRGDDDDVADKAAAVAAQSGGTHVVLTDKGVEYFTVTNPGVETKDCKKDGQDVDCQTTYTPATETTYEKPTASFLVFRVPLAGWDKLPETLRPAKAR
jgi:hypothetical protein